MRKSNPTPRTLALATLATGLLAAGILVAAPQDDEGLHRMHKIGERFLAKVDANGDGNISQAEHDAVRAAHLAELDRNADGFVTFEEKKAAREARARERFTSRHDTDGDGRVSIDEMAARGEDHFDRMDADDDGMVSPEEIREGRRMFRGHGKAGTR